MNTDKPRCCPACNKAELCPASRKRSFRPYGKNGEPIVVELLTSRCPACGAEATSASQHAENLRRLAARKEQYGEMLMGEEILALRRRWGITQQQAAKIFGKGKIAFSRYENETSYPDASTTKLLTLAMEMPEVMRRLAEKARVSLPVKQQQVSPESQDERDLTTSIRQVLATLLASHRKPKSSRKSQVIQLDKSVFAALEPHTVGQRYRLMANDVAPEIMRSKIRPNIHHIVELST